MVLNTDTPALAPLLWRFTYARVFLPFFWQILCEAGLGLDSVAAAALHHPHHVRAGPEQAPVRPHQESALLVLRRLGALLVGTAVWYLCTGLFLYVENLTGECSLQGKPGQPHRLYTSKQECHQDSGVWNGFDISGHCFLLSYCAMMILEEVAVLEALSIEHSSKLRVLINVLLVSLCFLTVIWVFMFLSTALYFHDFSQKLLGVLIGLSAWYGTYRVWYLKPFSPGLPLPKIPLSSKKYSYSR